MVLTGDQWSLIVAGAAGVIALIALVWALVLQRRLGRLTKQLAGTDAWGGEAGLDQAARLADTAKQTEKLAGEIAQLQEIVPHALQHVGVVRFNPFSDTGSDQSFAIAVLDDRGDGLVLSTLYSRGSVRIYAKPVVACRSEYALSEEESQAISRARSSRP